MSKAHRLVYHSTLGSGVIKKKMTVSHELDPHDAASVLPHVV